MQPLHTKYYACLSSVLICKSEYVENYQSRFSQNRVFGDRPVNSEGLDLANVRRSLHDLYTLVNVFEVASTDPEMRSGPKIVKVGKITCPFRHVSDLILHIFRSYPLWQIRIPNWRFLTSTVFAIC